MHGHQDLDREPLGYANARIGWSLAHARGILGNDASLFGITVSRSGWHRNRGVFSCSQTPRGPRPRVARQQSRRGAAGQDRREDHRTVVAVVVVVVVVLVVVVVVIAILFVYIIIVIIIMMCIIITSSSSSSSSRRAGRRRPEGRLRGLPERRAAGRRGRQRRRVNGEAAPRAVP